MTLEQRFETLEEMELVTENLVSALRYAKVLARMEMNGQQPERHTTLEKVDEAIDHWNLLINRLPKDLKQVKLSLLK